MRRNIVAGNWKMNKTLSQGVSLASEIASLLKDTQRSCDVIIAPPFVHLASVAEVLKGTGICVAAQNSADHESGAYTGEVSPEMVASTGASHVILGHSERRSYYGETNEIVKNKVELALKFNLKPIVCVGEKLEERESGKFFDVISSQVKDSLCQLTPEQFANVIVAYEPVWAIGTGKTATAEQAEEIHSFIRKIIADCYNAQTADDLTILYGGSCKPSNAKELFAKPDVDGGLIGGASLKAEDFIGIITAF